MEQENTRAHYKKNHRNFEHYYCNKWPSKLKQKPTFVLYVVLPAEILLFLICSDLGHAKYGEEVPNWLVTLDFAPGDGENYDLEAYYDDVEDKW